MQICNQAIICYLKTIALEDYKIIKSSIRQYAKAGEPPTITYGRSSLKQLRDNKRHLNKYWLLDKDSVYILLYEQ